MDSSRAAVRAVTTATAPPDVDDRVAAAIGRRARLELTFGCRRGRTVLTHAYVEPPFRIGRVLDAGAYAHVILVCCGPGMFGGDALEQRVRVDAGARVLLVSQAALQVHAVPDAGAAVLESHYEVAAGAELDCVWDPVIPFAGARLKQRIDLHVSRDSGLFWSDALMSGRAGRGESWRFGEIDHELRLRIEGSVRYLERYRLTPASRNVGRPWMAGAAQYAGTMVAHHEEATEPRAEALQQALDVVSGISGGADRLEDRLIVGRIIAESGPRFAEAREAFRRVFNRPPPRR